MYLSRVRNRVIYFKPLKNILTYKIGHDTLEITKFQIGEIHRWEISRHLVADNSLVYQI